MSRDPFAFPVSAIDGSINLGMTLRDYFAAALFSSVHESCGTWESAARKAYEVADHMLKARNDP